MVSKPSDAPNLKENNVRHSCFFWSLALCVSISLLRLSLDRAPHVRPVPLIRLSSHEFGTHGPTSLAIWDKKKIIIAIAGGAWGINVIFQIQGKLLPSAKGQKSLFT